MNNINQYIIEKLKVNSKTKIGNSHGIRFNQEAEEKIIDTLCQYCQRHIKIKYYYYNSFIIGDTMETKIRKFRQEKGITQQKLAELVGVDVNDLAKYIEENNDELYKEIKEFVLK